MTDKADLTKFHADIERFMRRETYSSTSEYVCLCQRAVWQETTDAVDMMLAMASRRGPRDASETLSLMFGEAMRANNDSMMNYLIPLMAKPLPTTLLLRAAKDKRQNATELLLPHCTKEAIFDELTVLVFHNNPDPNAFAFFYEHSNKEDIVDFYEGLKKNLGQFDFVGGVILFLERAKVDFEHSVLQNLTDKIVEQRERAAIGDAAHLSVPLKTRRGVL